MTIAEIFFKMLAEEKDEKKLKALEEIGEYLTPYMEHQTDEKMNARKLFDLSQKLVEAWPEFAVATIALSLLGQYGIKDEDVKPEDIFNSDINDIADLE